MEDDVSPRKLSRVTRSGRISPQQAARDLEIRRKIEQEFPPLQEEATPGSVRLALKNAIEGSNLSVYEISKRAKVAPIVVSRFLSGERDIRMATADRLARVLGLKLVVT